MRVSYPYMSLCLELHSPRRNERDTRPCSKLIFIDRTSVHSTSSMHYLWRAGSPRAPSPLHFRTLTGISFCHADLSNPPGQACLVVDRARRRVGQQGQTSFTLLRGLCHLLLKATFAPIRVHPCWSGRKRDTSDREPNRVRERGEKRWRIA